MEIRKSGEIAVNATLTAVAIAAIVLTGVVVRREMFLPPTDSTVQKLTETETPDWHEFANGGYRIGNESAPVMITVFSDYQCEFCKRLHELLRSVQQKHSGKIAVVYRHLPLVYLHPFAMQAALSAECVGTQGRFESFNDILYENQTTIGTAAWVSFAQMAQVPDTARFTKCLETAEFAARVQEDMSAAQKLNATGTPLMLVNDKRILGTPSRDHLLRLVNAAIRKSTGPIARNE